MQIYTPRDIRGMNDRAVRQAYADLRKVAQKRQKRLSEQNLSSKKFKFPMTRVLTDDEARYYLAEVSRYLRDPFTKVKRARQQRDYTLSQLHKRRLDFITADNFTAFTDYMDQLRDQYAGQVYDSGDAADIFNETQRIGVDPEVVAENFEYFQKHQEELRALNPRKSGKGYAYSTIQKKIRALK